MDEKLKEGEELQNEEVVEEETVENGGEVSEGAEAEETKEEGATEPETTEEEEVQAEEAEEKPVEEKMLTQSQVNELVGRARQEGRESAMKELLTRYGVGDEAEMGEVFGKGQAYDSLNDEYTGVNASYKEVMAENALLKSNIDMSRWNDVKLILGGSGLEVTEENIAEMLPSHPEWKANGVVSTFEENGNTAPEEPKKSVIRKLGSEVSKQEDGISEEEKFRKLFGFNQEVKFYDL